MNHARLGTIITAAVLAAPVSLASAQTTYQPAPPGKQTLDKRNWLNPAQRSDLSMEFDHEFVLEDCPSPAEQAILKGLKVDIVIQWENDGRWNQGESKDDVGDADQFILHWEGSQRWSLETATNQGSSMFGGGGSGGGASAQPFGNGTVDGIQVTVPADVETGDDKLEMELFFKYRPDPGDDCGVKGISFMGEFIHTYEGPTRLRVKPSLKIGVSGPPPKLNAGLSLSPELFHDTYAWSKQLFDAGGKEHRKYLDPPANAVPVEDCCGEVYETDHKDTEFGPVETVIGGDSMTAKCLVVPTSHGVQSAWIAAFTHEGYALGWNNVAFDVATLEPFQLGIDFLDDPVVTGGGIDILVATVDSTGRPGWATGAIEGSGPSLPTFESETFVIGEVLEAIVDGDDPSAGTYTALVLDERGEIADQESFDSATPAGDALRLGFATTGSNERSIGDGVLQLQGGDRVELFSESTTTEGSIMHSLAVLEDRADSIDAERAETVESDGISFHGETTGGELVLDFFNAGEAWEIVVPGGLDGRTFEIMLVERLLESGMDVGVELLEPAGIRFGGAAIRVGVDRIDGGIALRSATHVAPGSPADLNLDGIVDGTDFGIFLGNFGVQGVGIPGDINQDQIVDGTDLGLLIADWS
ncbi:MAG: hypothetical protein VX012_10410 [Planctomycetota bacterium]|nr:hypothetical protein [Planctomycetota bacterium]